MAPLLRTPLPQMVDVRPFIEKAVADFESVVLDSEVLLVDKVGAAGCPS